MFCYRAVTLLSRCTVLVSADIILFSADVHYKQNKVGTGRQAEEEEWNAGERASRRLSSLAHGATPSSVQSDN
ncbi:hypothetical protein J6590_043649 [Homalodisca vitripennis]|nr:hypothetical protein J6590_043649 [Homalodisca vitripennis]